MIPNTVVIHTSSVRPAHFEAALAEIKRPSSTSEAPRRRSSGSPASRWKRFSDADLSDYSYIGITVGSTDAYAAAIVEIGSGNARLLMTDCDTITHTALVNEFLGLLTHNGSIRTAVINDKEYFIERVDGLGADSLHLFDAHALRVVQRTPVCIVTHDGVVKTRDACRDAIAGSAFTLVIDGADD